MPSKTGERCRHANEVVSSSLRGNKFGQRNIVGRSRDRVEHEPITSIANVQRGRRRFTQKYAEVCRTERFKAEPRGGSDIVTAMFEAGYGSSSRLYEKASENLGMTPATSKKGGKGMNINYVITDCE